MTAMDSSVAAGPPPGMKVRLSSNEAAYGPSPAAIAAAAAKAPEAHIYCDDQAIALRAALAEFEDATPEEICCGNGSAALLMDLIASHSGPGDEILAFARSFIIYRVGARNSGASYVEVPTAGPPTDLDAAQQGWARDPQALLARITERTKVVLVDNPGNPTGTHLTGDQVRELVAGVPEHVVVVLDEAYHQFAAGQRGYATVAELGITHPRLVVARTFSKAYALAGLRVGYLVGAPEVVRATDAHRSRFNVNAIGQAAAVAALADQPWLEDTVARVIASRTRLADGLRAQGVRFTDGLGNFLTVEAEGDAASEVAALATHDVGVRPLLPYGMTDQYRVTVGTDDEVDAFLAALLAVRS